MNSNIIRLYGERNSNSDNPLIAQLVSDLWLPSLKQSVAESTYSLYSTNINTFLNWSGVEYPAEITVQLIEQYLQRRCKNQSKHSISNQIKALRSLFRCLIDRQIVHYNPAMKVQIPRTQKKSPRFLSLKQVGRLLGYVSGRDELIVNLLYRAGLRNDELCRLKWTDIDLDSRLIHLIGKGNKPGVVPISDGLLTVLYGHYSSKDRLVVLGRSGQPMNRGSVNDVMIRLSKELGFYIRAHLLRHSIASHLAQAGVSIYKVAKLLRHSDIKVTIDHYAALTTESLRDDINLIDRLV